jgi:hypothetical protein
MIFSRSVIRLVVILSIVITAIYIWVFKGPEERLFNFGGLALVMFAVLWPFIDDELLNNDKQNPGYKKER